MIKLTGKAYPHKSSDCQDATVTLYEKDKLLLEVGGERIHATLAEVTITPAATLSHTHILFPDGRLFQAEKQPELKVFLHSTGSVSWIARLEGNLGVVLVSVLAVAAIITGTFTHGIPWLSEKVTHLLPDTAAEFVGKQVLSSLDEDWFEASELSQERQDEIEERFRLHIRALKEAGYEFPFSPSLEFRHWQGGMNAFALSDGTIILTDAMVRSMETSAQLDSVLFHELGHVYHEHVMESMVRSSLLSVSVALLTGEASGIIDNLAGAGVLLFTSGYSQDDEREADIYGAELMLETYGTTEPMKKMFEKLKSQEGVSMPQWLSSHPDTQERIDALN